MATQSPPPSTPPDPAANAQPQGQETPNAVVGDGNDVKQENTAPPPFKISQPLREDQVQNAVNFLSHPKVRSSPIIHRRSFLEKKGLTSEEIDEAFRRVPDPSSTSTAVETVAKPVAVSAQQKVPTASTHLQVQQQNPQLPVASLTPTVQQTKYKWSSILLAVGVIAASGASSALIFKKVLLPKVKGWIRRVAAEKDDTVEEEKMSSVAEDAAEAAKAAASAAALVAKASQELLSSKSEEKKFFEAFKGALDVQVKEMKSMSEAIRRLESRKDDGLSEDKLRMEQYHSTVGNGTYNNAWANKNQQYKANGASNRDFGEVRPSSAPAFMQPVPVQPSNSYMEFMDMAQRGEKPPGVKPWEVPQQVQNNYSNSSQYQSSDEAPYTDAQENFGTPHTNGKSHDASQPFWNKKSIKHTEVYNEVMESSRQFPHGAEIAEKPKPRAWFPPQPPSVAIPEAAAAIRKPKSAPKQQSSDTRSVVSSDDGEEAAPMSNAGSSNAYVSQSEIQEENADTVEIN